MPDMERLTRQLELDMAGPDNAPVVAAYHAGLSRARKEVAVITGIAVLTFLALRFLAG